MLFKYSPIPRFFEEGLIRFTQPSALNDPDDARPELVIGKYAPEDYARARAEAKRVGMVPASDEDLEIFLSPFPSMRYDEKSFPGLWPKQEPRLRKKPFRTLHEFDRAVAERAIELWRHLADQKLGILSLSASADEAMWAYYAADHQGVAIAFDETHPFFANQVQPVDYSDIPVSISTNLGWVRLGGNRLDTEDILNGKVISVPRELVLRKRLGWRHEKEWRMVASLSGAKKNVGNDDNGYSVYLFELPPAAVQSVTFGFRANDNFIDTAMRHITRESRWNPVRIIRRRRLSTGRIEDEILR